MTASLPIPFDIDALSDTELRDFVPCLLEDHARLATENAALRAEVARLNGLKSKPDIKPSKPSGMEQGDKPPPKDQDKKKRGRGAKNHPPERVENQILKATNIPEGSRFKGYEDFTIQDVKIVVKTIRYRRERWLTPDGRTILAPLPPGVEGHFGPELKRFILAQYHQGQTTIPRLVTLLQSIGLAISKRQVVRILTESKSNDQFRAEAKAVLRTGLAQGEWISVDDTGARHKGRNGFCTQIGNDRFTFFATTTSKNCGNFLDLLRAGRQDYVLNEQAFAHMRRRNLSAAAIDVLMAHPARTFPDAAAWQAHLAALGLTGQTLPSGLTRGNQATIATEGALWGTIADDGLLDGTVIVSDDAGQFNVGKHALCWVHAERLIHKLDAFTATARTAKEAVRGQVWDFFAELKAWRLNAEPHRKPELQARFDTIFQQKTGFVTLDRLLARLHANKAELLMVLEHPKIPLHTNGSENDIRDRVTRRDLSGTTRSDRGRDCLDSFLGLKKTCHKLGVSFWDYLGSRLRAITEHIVPPLPDLIEAHSDPP
jgi:hypothetical protein